MRHIVYLGDGSCGPCRAYKESVIDPINERHPGAIEVHPKWDARFARADAVIPVKTVPTMIVEKDGVEEFRFSAMIPEDQLEAIVTHEGDVLTLGDVTGR